MLEPCTEQHDELIAEIAASNQRARMPIAPICKDEQARLQITAIDGNGGEV
jgi:hypothetical protein